MNLEEIRQLIDLANESGVAELEVQRGEDRVRIRRAVASVQDFAVGVEARGAAGAAPPASAAAQPQPLPSATPASEDENLIIVKSPIVGTFYHAPAPDQDPFVAVGDTVRKGEVLCIIESMKLMNEIESEHAGVIAAVYAENGQPVEYGEPLMAIRPH
jgi:acetyl-CoA carboxylase biotin carboxyl carrier protein